MCTRGFQGPRYVLGTPGLTQVTLPQELPTASSDQFTTRVPGYPGTWVPVVVSAVPDGPRVPVYQCPSRQRQEFKFLAHEYSEKWYYFYKYHKPSTRGMLFCKETPRCSYSPGIPTSFAGNGFSKLRGNSCCRAGRQIPNAHGARHLPWWPSNLEIAAFHTRTQDRNGMATELLNLAGWTSVPGVNTNTGYPGTPVLAMAHDLAVECSGISKSQRFRSALCHGVLKWQAVEGLWPRRNPPRKSYDSQESPTWSPRNS
eukprot:805020-Rhodomonas_salina.1